MKSRVILLLLVLVVAVVFCWQIATAQPVVNSPVLPVPTTTTIQLPNAAVVPPRMLVDFVTINDARTGLPTRRVTVVDPETKRICVYSIALGGQNDGKIELLSVRHINTDLQVEVFNGMDPTPGQIQESLRNSSSR
ncbi:MAG: hypothetical protein LBU65_14565 [Planctomycetaceae bacterium]|nr:hypothetical protein [Planctomycetaceae bacterium]